jgi:hypothetical protein
MPDVMLAISIELQTFSRISRETQSKIERHGSYFETVIE